MTTSNEKLIAALMQFADSRGHWLGCSQTRRIAIYTKFGRDGSEIPTPCTARCKKAREAVEAVGGTVVQKVGSALRSDRSDDFYRQYPHCTLGDPNRLIHKDGCAHLRGAA